MDCPHCRGEIALSPEHWGRTWTCPHCHKPFHAAQPAGLPRDPLHPATVTAAGTRQTVANCRGCGQRYYRVSDPAADRCPSCGLPANASPGGTRIVAPAAVGAMGAFAGPQASSRTLESSHDFDVAQIHSRLNTIQGCILASAIANLVLGSLLTATCYGAVLGLPMIILAIFELVHHSKRQVTPPYQYASTSITLGIFELIVGVFNVISLIMGILVLGYASSVKSTCERRRIYV